MKKLQNFIESRGWLPEKDEMWIKRDKLGYVLANMEAACAWEMKLTGGCYDC